MYKIKSPNPLLKSATDDSQTVAILTQMALTDTHLDVREAAVVELGRIRPPVDAEIFQHILNENGVKVGLKVVEVISHRRDDAAFTLLLIMSHSENESIAQKARELLEMHRKTIPDVSQPEKAEPENNGILSQLGAWLRSGYVSLWQLADGKYDEKVRVKDVPQLGYGMKYSEREARLRACKSLRSLRHSATLQYLLMGLMDELTEISETAMWGLVNLGSVAVQPLLKMLSVPFAVPRQRVAMTLSFMEPLPLQSLLAALEQDCPFMRAGALETLSMVRVPVPLSPILRCLEDKHEEVRRAALSALGNIAPDDSIGQLAQALKDPSATIRAAAMAALEKSRAPQADTLWHEALESEYADVRQKTVGVLIRSRSPKIVEHLMTAVKNEKGERRQEAVEVLGEIGDLRAIDPLAELLAAEGKRGAVPDYLLMALVRLGDTRALPHLAEKYEFSFDSGNSEVKKCFDFHRHKFPVADNNYFCARCRRRAHLFHFYHNMLGKLQRAVDGFDKYFACPVCHSNRYLIEYAHRSVMIFHPGQSGSPFEVGNHRPLNSPPAYKETRNSVDIWEVEAGPFSDPVRTLIYFWAEGNDSMDFDEIRIVAGDDFQIEKMTLKIIKNLDHKGRERLKTIPFHIKEDLQISTSKMNLLKEYFSVKIERPRKRLMNNE